MSYHTVSGMAPSSAEALVSLLVPSVGTVTAPLVTGVVTITPLDGPALGKFLCAFQRQ